jgi:hypothetical protein
VVGALGKRFFTIITTMDISPTTVKARKIYMLKVNSIAIEAR